MTEEHGIAAGLGGLDLNSLLSAAQDMQTQMVESQRALAEMVVEGQSGGGAVTIAVTGGLEFRSVSIADEVVDPDDVTMLEDLVLAALRDAIAQVNAAQAESNPLAGLPMAGGLGGLLGGA